MVISYRVRVEEYEGPVCSGGPEETVSSQKPGPPQTPGPVHVGEMEGEHWKPEDCREMSKGKVQLKALLKNCR